LDAARLLPVAGNSSQALGEGTAMAEMALAAAVNLPKLTEQLLAQDAETGSSSDDNNGSANGGSSSSSMLQQNKSSLLSAAAAVAAAATAFAGAIQQQQEGQPGSSSSSTSSGAGSSAVAAAGVAPTSARDVQALLEEEVNAMNCLLDGRWVVGGWVVALALSSSSGVVQPPPTGCCNDQKLPRPSPCQPATWRAPFENQVCLAFTECRAVQPCSAGHSEGSGKM
jgi:hypothetical protein